MSKQPAITKPKRGRPTTLTPALEESLFKLVSEGKTYKEACRTLRINYATVTTRKYTDDSFYRRSARATLLGTEANIEMAETRLRNSTNKRISVDRELAHHYRWKASKLLSAYKDRVDVRLDAEVHLEANDPRDSWRHKPLGQWTQDERMEGGRRLAYVFKVLGDDLRHMGLPDQVREVCETLGVAIYRECTQTEQAAPVLKLSAPVEINPMKPGHPEASEQPAEAIPAESEEAREQREADLREARRQARIISIECAKQSSAFPQVVTGSRSPWGKRR